MNFPVLTCVLAAWLIFGFYRFAASIIAGLQARIKHNVDALAVANERIRWQGEVIHELQVQNIALNAQLNEQWVNFAESLYLEKP